MSNIDPHLTAASLACEAVCTLLEVLPHTDLVWEITGLMATQQSILLHLMDGTHFGSAALNRFMMQSHLLREEAIRLKEEQD